MRLIQAITVVGVTALLCSSSFASQPSFRMGLQAPLLLGAPDEEAADESLNARVNAPFSFSPSLDAGMIAPFAWRLLSGSFPAGVSMDDPATGILTGTPTAAGKSAAIIEVTDTNGIAKSITLAFDVITATLSYPVVAGKVGEDYAAAPVIANTVGAVSYAGSSGLPPGVTVDPATGQITGRPTAAGTYRFNVIATDELGSYPSETLEILIDPPEVVAELTGIPSPIYARTTESFVVRPVLENAVGPVTWSATGLAPGLMINPTQGVITGRALPPGQFLDPITNGVEGSELPYGTTTGTATITATDAGTGEAYSATVQQYAYKPLTLTVQAAYNAQPRVGTPVVNWIMGAPVSARIGTFSYDIASGSLPPGTSVHPTTGAFIGTPTEAGTFDFVVRVTDSGDGAQAVSNPQRMTVLRAAAPFSISLAMGGTVYNPGVTWLSRVNDAPVLWPIPSLTGQAFGKVTWSLGSGDPLPPGLFLDPNTGAISGTASHSAFNRVRLLATDAAGNKALSEQIPIQVHAAFRWFWSGQDNYIDQLWANPDTRYALRSKHNAFQTKAMDETGQGQIFFTRAYTGGDSATTWSMTGSIPPGMTFYPNSEGMIAGTPTVTSGTYTATVTGREIDGKTFSRTLTLIVK